jgi:DNA-binding response OmpR family regulator
MIIQNVIIYKLNTLFEILNEISRDIGIDVIEAHSENNLKNIIQNSSHYLIVTQQNISTLDNQLQLINIPIKISKLIEMINVKLLKNQFSNQSKVKIKNYILNLNSREISNNNTLMKHTKIYLSKTNKPVSINELEKNVWQYEADMETHTVETHIYRLRKKLYDKFKDKDFIVSKKNGYEIS